MPTKRGLTYKSRYWTFCRDLFDLSVVVPDVGQCALNWEGGQCPDGGYGFYALRSVPALGTKQDPSLARLTSEPPGAGCAQSDPSTHASAVGSFS